jgi:hypothetical protein
MNWKESKVIFVTADTATASLWKKIYDCYNCSQLALREIVEPIRLSYAALSMPLVGRLQTISLHTGRKLLEQVRNRQFSCRLE